LHQYWTIGVDLLRRKPLSVVTMAALVDGYLHYRPGGPAHYRLAELMGRCGRIKESCACEPTRKESGWEKLGAVLTSEVKGTIKIQRLWKGDDMARHGKLRCYRAKCKIRLVKYCIKRCYVFHLPFLCLVLIFTLVIF
jgi:hypothetical protein